MTSGSASTADQPPAPDEDPVIQMNVRVPQSLRDRIDARRATKGLSRDRWVANALRYALDNPPPRRPFGPAGARRTAPPPARRPNP